MNWYEFLIKPPLTPPSQTFMVVWPILYAMMAVSFLLILKTEESDEKSKAKRYFIIQLLLNFLWSPVFFTLKSPAIALFVLILLMCFLFLTIFFAYKKSKTAAFLLFPYAIWSVFALYLNIGIIILN